MQRLIVERKLRYRNLRGIQISTVFFVTIIIQELYHIPRAGWTGFALMMIYAGFDNGTTILRATDRFLGMLWGLLLGYVLWFLGHMDYRLLFLIIPATIYFAYFFAGQAYAVPTVFTVCTSLIGSGYFVPNTSQFNVSNFVVDYLICTIIAFALIFVFEYLVFRPHRMMQLFIEDTQWEIIQKLEELIDLIKQDKVGRGDWFKHCISYTQSLFQMQLLAYNAEFIVGSKPVVSNEFKRFVELNNQIFINLKGLYFARFTAKYQKYDYQHLYQHVESDLAILKRMAKHLEKKNTDEGGLSAEAH